MQMVDHQRHGLALLLDAVPCHQVSQGGGSAGPHAQSQVMLAGCLLGPRLALRALVLFLVAVAIGLPLLSGGRGGFGRRRRLRHVLDQVAVVEEAGALHHHLCVGRQLREDLDALADAAAKAGVTATLRET